MSDTFVWEAWANQKRLHDLSVMQSRVDAQESEVRTFIKKIRRYAAIEKLDELAMYLYEKETITGDEFMDILDRK